MIATVVAITGGAALGSLTTYLAMRHGINRLRAALSDAVWRLTHDPLTDLHNRLGLRVAHQATTASGDPGRIIVLLIDLDLFKQVNDAHGHDAGDELLRAAADRIGQLAALYGGHAARLSGDEFAAVIPLGRHEPARLAEHFIVLIAEPVTVTGDDGPVTVTITASLGVNIAAGTDLLEGVALHHADLAMYQAKQQGGNRYVFHQPGMTMPDHRPRRGPRLRDRRRTQNGDGA
ncbi:GGDEF domain-containing protein [Actinoplanes sp. NPDC049802]|uniref:GGDEF domain-containing protein n=1 Tax=Actinoplanes sp. NPDC049802 TaxID=3154742 RepID=UPI0033DE5820